MTVPFVRHGVVLGRRRGVSAASCQALSHSNAEALFCHTYVVAGVRLDFMSEIVKISRMPSDSDTRATWIERILGVRVGAGSGVTPFAAQDMAEALGAWQAERKLAIAGLNKLEMLVRASNHPETDAAVRLLRAIRANLTETPETERQVAELARYVEEDEVFATAEMPNVFGVALNIRAPLDRALAALRIAMTAREG